jgi:phosphate transport system permease protein
MKSKIFFAACSISAVIAFCSLAALMFFILKNGLSVISWEFITQVPRQGMTAGGIAPAVIGSFYLSVFTILFSLPLGLSCAIYLNEYSPKGYIADLIKMGINNLAGVPSVVFGLFGLAVFVKFFGFGISILSGSLTLSILVLPSIIASSQEALSAVPASLREASLALGAGTWQTIRKTVLPAALPGILTGIILSIGRAAGETAPIIFTAAVFYKRGYPTGIMSEVMALPYHIYALMSEGTDPEKQTAIAYGCALILLLLTALLTSLAVIIRNKNQNAIRN